MALPRLLGHWAEVKGAAGEFPAAAAALAEAEAIAEATGAGPDWDSVSPWVVAWSVDEAEERSNRALQERKASSINPALYGARAMVYNAAGGYEAALEAAQRSCDIHPFGVMSWSLVELVEAAARCGQRERAGVALEQLVDRTRVASTDWSLGIEARSAALLEDDPAVAETRYRDAIDRLGGARTRPDLARAHLVFGEWLRRENRRLDARAQLRTAHELFSEIGMPGFAERARRELAATGETARKRTDETRGDLTAQEGRLHNSHQKD